MAEPRYKVYYDDRFQRDLEKLGFNVELFERLCKHGLDPILARDPFDPCTHPVPGAPNVRVVPTDEMFPDFPSVMVGFSVDTTSYIVVIEGVEPAWGPDDLVPRL